ncbi:hypothetical protein BHM03_00026202 [Ensete ventricosum]|nr:hypothetical protein BHM03_00026202 [Ensete ventricosum]
MNIACALHVLSTRSIGTVTHRERSRRRPRRRSVGMEGGGTVVDPPGTTGSPPSPGVPPVGLSDDHMEELLRFTLSLAVSPTADDPHLALSLFPDYCSRLLQPEPSPLSPLPLVLGTSDTTMHPLSKFLEIGGQRRGFDSTRRVSEDERDRLGCSNLG